MGILSLSIRCLVRKKAKTILLLSIVFVTSCLIYAGWACKSANVQTQTEGKQALGASFRMEENEADRHDRTAEAIEKLGGQNGSVDGSHIEQLESGDWMISHDNSFETLQMEDIETLARQEVIAEYNITTANIVVNPVNFVRIEDPDVDQHSDLLGVSLRGNMDMRLDFDVWNGNIEVNEGRMITPEDKDVCVISRELAEVNGLTVGDKLEFNSRKDRETSKVYSAEIVGVYDTIHKITPIMYGDSYRSENIIMTDLRFPEKPQGCEGDPLYQYATFWVENVDEYDTVKEQIKKADINWKRYDFIDNTGMSDTMAENFGDLDEMSSIILILVAVSGVVIIFLVFLFWLKGRVHEIGIFLAIGKSKAAIIAQMMMEGILIGCISFMLATICAPALSKSIADYLVGYQVKQEEEQRKADEGMTGGAGVAEYETEVMGVETKVTRKVILLSASSILGVIFVAVSSSCIFVVIQKPKEILSKMS
ncbi:ABC transporter permease [Lachnospiraceae bacterium]|nr:ABC transporter permease [Lachnospiraceae bacterium]